MFLARQVSWTPLVAIAMLASVAIAMCQIAGCGHAEGRTANSSNATVTLGSDDASSQANDPVLPASASDSDSATTSTTDTAIVPSHSKVVREGVAAADETSATANIPPPNPPLAREGHDAESGPQKEETRSFKVEGPESALRVSYDDFDLLKVMNLDPVPKDAPERLPKWLKALDGKRIRVRGFMFPPFQDTGIRGFVLARDNQICCFGRTPKEYDLVDVFLRKGVTTNYIQNRPFDVVGVFRIKSDIEKYTAMYELDDAVLIDKQ